MRRYPLPPPGMWPCERPIVHVLNGDYPAAELRRMTVPGLERLVAKLVQRTSKTATKPQWWPQELVFTHPLDLGLSTEREIKFAFKQLIVSCCKFFKANDARPSRPISSKDQFLHNLRLHPALCKPAERPSPPPPLGPARFAACVHIPFSSDVGRIMAAREQHSITEDLKMRRLERTEWYTNKGASKASAGEFEVTPYREPRHSHVYKMPKRQHYQKRRSLRNWRFLARFCTPLSVLVPQVDLCKLQSDSRRKLVVMIRDTDKICCDLRNDLCLARTSPRLRNV